VTGLQLSAGQYTATFRPDTQMICTSLTHGLDEYVTWPRTITQFREGKMTAIPPVHPWINRLGGRHYRAAGTEVDLTGLELPTDPNGLPIHGNLLGAMFDVVTLEPARLVAQLDFGAHPDKLRAFPFPHVIAIDAQLDAEHGLTLTTEVRATGDTPVPVSFGWHPYLRMPAGGRAGWELTWPECEHVEVDDNVIPTGVRTPQPAERAPIARRTYDDHYALGADRTFAVHAEGRTLTLEYDDGYPFAQLFVPPRRQIIAIEPMTSEIDAVGRNIAPLCNPGDTYTASFSITITR
jgi:galactose mutarotase-like enzyme